MGGAGRVIGKRPAIKTIASSVRFFDRGWNGAIDGFDIIWSSPVHSLLINCPVVMCRAIFRCLQTIDRYPASTRYTVALRLGKVTKYLLSFYYSVYFFAYFILSIAAVQGNVCQKSTSISFRLSMTGFDLLFRRSLCWRIVGSV